MRKSKLSIEKQNRLIELFVAGSIARTAAAIVDIDKTTATYYFKRLRILILSIANGKLLSILTVKLNLTKAILEVFAKANGGEVLLGRSQYPGFRSMPI